MLDSTQRRAAAVLNCFLASCSRNKRMLEMLQCIGVYEVEIKSGSVEYERHARKEKEGTKKVRCDQWSCSPVGT